MDIKIKKAHNLSIVPSWGTAGAAGCDLYYCDNATQVIRPGETKKLGTGVCYEIPDGYVGFVFARSGLATKQGLAPANKVGVIDSDYRGEIMVALHNNSSTSQVVEYGQRIAQIVIVPCLKYNIVEGDLSQTDRGDGGFGSTGKS